MIVEIRKVDFVNKGAHLMLLAAMQRMKAQYPDVRFAMEPHWNSPYEARAKLALFQKIRLRRRGIAWDKLAGAIPKRLRDDYGLVLDNEMDVVLDAAGFSYGDQWGPRSTIETAEAVRKWKKRGTKVIFLPQALGPFESTAIRKAFKTIVDHSDLIFARERISFEHIEKLTGRKPHVRMAPDFTNLIAGVIPEDFDFTGNRCCLIPNMRMIDKVSTQEAQAYVPFMAACLKILYDARAKPFFLIHEGREDFDLAKKIIALAGIEANIHTETDPLKIKGILGASDAVISSRYHALIGALSQGVPALATGWSHKYNMLLEDYNFSEGLLSVNAVPSQIEQSLSVLIDSRKRAILREGLKIAADKQKKLAEDMWKTIFAVISQ